MWDYATIKRNTYADAPGAGTQVVPVEFAAGRCRVELMAANSTYRTVLENIAGWLAGTIGYAIHFEQWVDVRPGDEIIVLPQGESEEGASHYLGGIPLGETTMDYDITIAARLLLAEEETGT